MRREISVYLDAARFGAAVLVFIGHVNGVSNNAFGKIGHLAPDAVAIFFVLSGFVIAFVTSRREQSWQSYAEARAVRIYSVAILAIFVTIDADFVRSNFLPSASATPAAFFDPGHLASVVSSLLFTGEFWNNHPLRRQQ